MKCKNCGQELADHFGVPASKEWKDGRGYAQNESVTIRLCPTATFEYDYDAPVTEE